MMNHNEIEQKLTDYYFGELSAVEEQVVREHLTSCPECRQILSELTSVVKTLKHDLVDDDVPIKLLKKEQRQQIFMEAEFADTRQFDTVRHEVSNSESEEASSPDQPSPSEFRLIGWLRVHRRTVLSTAAGLMIAWSIWMLILPRSFRHARLSQTFDMDQAEELGFDKSSTSSDNHKFPLAEQEEQKGYDVMEEVASTLTTEFAQDKLAANEIPEKSDRERMATGVAESQRHDVPAAAAPVPSEKNLISSLEKITGGKAGIQDRLDNHPTDSEGENFLESAGDVGMLKTQLASLLQAEINGVEKEVGVDDGEFKKTSKKEQRESPDELTKRNEEVLRSTSSTARDLDYVAQLDKEKKRRSSDQDAQLSSTSPVEFERFDLSDEVLHTLKTEGLENQEEFKQVLKKLGVELGYRSSYHLNEEVRELVVVNPEESEKRDVGHVLDRLQAQLDANKEKFSFTLPAMIDTRVNAVSTFSIDVDTASYTAARKDILNGNRPDPLSIRQEEFINYFDYKYKTPNHKIFAIYTDYARSPFRKNTYLLRVAIQGKRPGSDTKRPSVFTLVVDTSGSMAEPNRLPMVQRQLPHLLEQMRPQDKISVISTDVKPRLVLDQVPITQKDTVIKSVKRLRAKGATNLEEGLVTAYNHAERNYAGGAYNRIVLFSDGVANLGEVKGEEIRKRVENARKLGITFTAIGVGRGLYNDELLETLANTGDGNYLFVDSDREAKRVFVDNFSANFNVIARDVKIQVEFNPRKVTHFRLIGYDNRRLKKEDFRNDAIDAGEVGAGQSVTALYEVRLAQNVSEDLCEVRLRYKDPDTYKVHEFNRSCGISNRHAQFGDVDWSFRLAAIAGEFAEYLRYGPTAKGTSPDDMLKEFRPLVHELSAEPTIMELQHLIMQVK